MLMGGLPRFLWTRRRANKPLMKRKFYHVTTQCNLTGIKASGLFPKIGPRSTLAGETTPYIYLFRDYAEMEDAVMNWLGDKLDDDQLVLCEIELTEAIERTLVYKKNSYEVLCPVGIPADCISFSTL